MNERKRLFKPSRFLALLRSELAERGRGHVLFLLTIMILLLLPLLLFNNASGSGWKQMNGQSQEFFYWMSLIPASMLFTVHLMRPLQRPSSTMQILLLPASSLEKWLLRAFMLLAFFPLGFTLVFDLVLGCYNFMDWPNRIIDADTLQAAYLPYLPFVYWADPESLSIWVAPSRLTALWFAHSWLLAVGFTLFMLTWLKRAAAIKALALGIGLLLLTWILLLYLASGSAYSWMSAGLFDRPAASGSGLRFFQILHWLGAPVLLWLAAFIAWRRRDLT